MNLKNYAYVAIVSYISVSLKINVFAKYSGSGSATGGWLVSFHTQVELEHG